MRVVLTGAPGTGKSTILRHLAGCGWITLPEVFRFRARLFGYHTKQEAVPNSAEDLIALQSFFEETPMLPGQVCCFDRCVVDLLAFAAFHNEADVTKAFVDLAESSAARIDIAYYSEIIPSSYQRDAFRNETIDTAHRLQEAILATYDKLSVTTRRLLANSISERVEQIRSQCMHGDLHVRNPRVAIVSAILSGPKGILMLRNSSTGEWTLPGGKVEAFENPQVAMIRELYEETAILVPDPGKSAMRPLSEILVPDRGVLKYFHIAMAVHPEVVTHPPEHDSCVWVKSKRALPHPVNPCIQRVVLSNLPNEC